MPVEIADEREVFTRRARELGFVENLARGVFVVLGVQRIGVAEGDDVAIAGREVGETVIPGRVAALSGVRSKEDLPLGVLSHPADE